MLLNFLTIDVKIAKIIGFPIPESIENQLSY